MSLLERELREQPAALTRLLEGRDNPARQAAVARWLEARGQEVPDIHDHHMPGATLMPGMLTPEEMDRLAAAKGADFDRLWLQSMIKHHDGALIMVDDLFSTPGAGQESEIFSFASDVLADQKAEMDRMAAMLEELQNESPH